MCRVSFCFVGATIGRPRPPAAMASLPGGYGIRPYSLPLAPSARGLRPQAVGERTVRLPEIFRTMAKFSPSAPSGHRPRRGRSACQKTSTLLYRECRGDHWSPASLAQQRAFRDGFLTRHTGTGEQCSPLQEFFDRLTSLAEGGFISSKVM